MTERELGRSGLKVSTLSLGCMDMSEFYDPNLSHGRMNRDLQSKSIRSKAFQILLRDHVQSEKITAVYSAPCYIGQRKGASRIKLEG